MKYFKSLCSVLCSRVHMQNAGGWGILMVQMLVICDTVMAGKELVQRTLLQCRMKPFHMK